MTLFAPIILQIPSNPISGYELVRPIRVNQNYCHGDVKYGPFWSSVYLLKDLRRLGLPVAGNIFGKFARTRSSQEFV